MHVRCKTLHLCMLWINWVICKSSVRVMKDRETEYNEGYGKQLQNTWSLKQYTFKSHHFPNCHCVCISLSAEVTVCVTVTFTHAHVHWQQLQTKQQHRTVIFTDCPCHGHYLIRKVTGTQRSLASAFWKLTDLEIIFFKYFHILSHSFHPPPP